MESNAKAINALSYLSVFFAPILCPLIIYFAVQNEESKHHAKRALISHLLTIVLFVLLILGFIFSFYVTPDNTLNTPMLLLLIASLILFIIANAVILIWNIVQAVKVIR